MVYKSPGQNGISSDSFKLHKLIRFEDLNHDVRVCPYTHYFYVNILQCL